MSAISGLFQFDEQPVLRGDLDRMDQALVPYGRDSSGRWLRGCFGMSHRLMRFTPEDRLERQPLADGPFVVAGDLRLDNREDMGRELGCTVGELRRLPDSALLLRAYKKWGSACVRRLIGAFAFAIWNSSTRTLFLARDQRGWKTLFYYRSPRHFVFASMPKGLFALPSVPRELNEGKVAEFLTLNHRNHSDTLYKGIYRLPPAHCMTITPTGERSERYWDLDPTKRIRLGSDTEYVERARELLGEVVKASLRSSGPVGAMMSGGFDSSTVACVAGQQLASRGSRLPVFTEVPRRGFEGSLPAGRYGDETALVEAIHSMNPNLDLNFVRSEGKSLFDGLDRRYALFESPQRNALNHIWIEEIHKRASSRGIRVLLGGQSGNMSLSYDGFSNLAELFRAGRWWQLCRELSGLRKSTPHSVVNLIKGRVIGPSLPDSFWRWWVAKRHGGGSAWKQFSGIHPDFAEAWDVDGRNQSVGHDPSYRLPADGREYRVKALTGADFKGDYQSMLAAAFGTESRDPLGDVRLLEYCLAIPQNQFLRDGQPRWLLRRLMAGILPTAVLENKKRGLQMADWSERLTESRAQVIEEIEALSRSKTASQMLDVSRLKELANDWPEDGWQKKETIMNYRLLLSRGIVVGRFIRWFEGDNL